MFEINILKFNLLAMREGLLSGGIQGKGIGTWIKRGD